MCVCACTYHYGRVSAGADGSGGERVEGGTGGELFGAEVVGAVAQTAADGTALVPTEEREMLRLFHISFFLSKQIKLRKSDQLKLANCHIWDVHFVLWIYMTICTHFISCCVYEDRGLAFFLSIKPIGQSELRGGVDIMRSSLLSETG